MMNPPPAPSRSTAAPTAPPAVPHPAAAVSVAPPILPDPTVQHPLPSRGTARASSASKQEVDPRKALSPGTVVGEYTIISKLGQGGFGITYRARHNGHGTVVVVKEHMPRSMAVRDEDSDFITFPTPEKEELFRATMKEFVEEVTVMMGMQHAGIVPILSAFEANGTAYYVMPFVYGKPLELSEEPTLSIAQRAREARVIKRLLYALLETLEYMGRHDVVHRDIKPENIMVTPDGHPVLLDFGSARQLHPGKVYTNIYTPGFCAPEQSVSKDDGDMTAQMGPWTDIYALGATFYYIITRMLPPRSEMRVAASPDPYKPLASRRDLRSLFGGAFLETIDRALELEPRNRWQTAAAWRGAIEDGILPAAPRLVRRMKVLGISACCAVALFGGISLWALQERNHAMAIYTNSLRFSESILYDFNEELADIPGSTGLQKQLGLHLKDYLRGMEQHPMGHDEKLQRAMAAAWLNLGSVYMMQGQLEESTDALRRATALNEQLIELRPNEKHYHFELARTLKQRAEVARRRNVNDVAQELLARSESELRTLCEEVPENPEYQCVLGGVLGELAYMARVASHIDVRKQYLQQRLELARDLVARYPRYARARKELGYALQDCGEMAMEEADFDTAYRLLEEEAGIFAELCGQQPYSMSFKEGLSLSYFVHGNLYNRISELSDDPAVKEEYDTKTLNAFSHHIELAREMEALDPNNAEYPFLQCRAIVYMVDALLRVNQPQLAISHCNTLMKKSEQLLQKAPDNVDYALLKAGAWRGLAMAHSLNPATYGKAEKEFEKYRSDIAARLARTPDNRTLSIAYMDALYASSDLAVKTDNREAARGWLLEAANILTRLQKNEPNNSGFRVRLEQVQQRLEDMMDKEKSTTAAQGDSR